MRQVFAHRLPETWSTPELVQDSIVADGLQLYRVGVAAHSPAGEEITGAAVELRAAPVDRGYFELLERISTVEAIASSSPVAARTAAGKATGSILPSDLFLTSDDPTRWRYARSNGVAIHDSWARACERAHFELVERDRVLRAWYGETRPRAVEVPKGTSLDRLTSYELIACEFPAAPSVSFGEGVEVLGLFGFPQVPHLPLLLGYGARRSKFEALDAAIGEILQALGFLWGEGVPSERPALGPTPAAHVESMLYPAHHGVLRAWLEEGHQRFAGVRPAPASGSTTYFDLTPHWLDGLFVAKATCPQASPLAFGDSPFVQHLPADLRAHPIP